MSSLIAYSYTVFGMLALIGAVSCIRAIVTWHSTQLIKQDVRQLVRRALANADYRRIS